MNPPNLNTGRRRYGFACVACRRKKVRCSGNTPSCQQCLKAGESCVYKASDACDLQLLQELQKAQSRIQALEAYIEYPSQNTGTSSSEEYPPTVTGTDGSGRQDNATPGASSYSSSWTSPAVADHSKGQNQDDENASQNDETLAEVSVDESGTLQYFGATSRFSVAGEHAIPVASTTLQTKIDQRWFNVNSNLVKSWERLALANLKHENTVDPATSSLLLQIYWNWQQPLHNSVYRRCFVRDMAFGGPYYSPFLINVMYAHASRFATDEDPRFHGIGRGEHFLAKAKILLYAEMEAPRPKISTIQGLIILGGRQCAIGNTSEGWLYTGMAIRMMKDIGLHLNAQKLSSFEKLEPDDLEARKRLFLSAYVWDKSISICLGRPPSLVETPHSPNQLFDYTDDEELFRPIGIKEIEDTYPPTKSYNTTAFVNFCRLAQIINEGYNVLYNGRIKGETLIQDVIDLEKRLRTFYRNLPECLRIDDASRLQYCPPPHIFSLNVLYHTILILIFRPFYFSDLETHELVPRARAVCIEEVAKVNEFFKAHERTFMFRNQTYLVSYCAYTASTIDAHEIKSDDETSATAAADRLGVTLRMLESEARQTPGIKRSIEIIKTGLRTQKVARQPRKSNQQCTPSRDSVFPAQNPASQVDKIRINYSAQPPALHLQHGLFHPDQSRPAQSSYEFADGVNDNPWLPNKKNTNEEPWLELIGLNAGAGFIPSSLGWNLEDTGAGLGSEGFANLDGMDWFAQDYICNPETL